MHTQIEEYNLYDEERKRNMRECVCLLKDKNKNQKKTKKKHTRNLVSRGHLCAFFVPIFFSWYCLVVFAIVNIRPSS